MKNEETVKNSEFLSKVNEFVEGLQTTKKQGFIIMAFEDVEDEKGFLSVNGINGNGLQLASLISGLLSEKPDLLSTFDRAIKEAKKNLNPLSELKEIFEELLKRSEKPESPIEDLIREMKKRSFDTEEICRCPRCEAERKAKAN